jgi:hypothetical protein
MCELMGKSPEERVLISKRQEKRRQREQVRREERHALCSLLLRLRPTITLHEMRDILDQALPYEKTTDGEGQGDAQ